MDGDAAYDDRSDHNRDEHASEELDSAAEAISAEEKRALQR